MYAPIEVSIRLLVRVFRGRVLVGHDVQEM